MAKEITLDDLAGMVKKGFDGVDKRFDQVDKRFDRLEQDNQKNHKEIKLRLSHLEFITTEMVRRDEFLELKRKVEMLEAKIA